MLPGNRNIVHDMASYLFRLDYMRILIVAMLGSMSIIIHIDYNIGLLIVVILFMTTVLIHGSIVIGRAYYYSITLYLLIFTLSIGNPVLHIDFKYHLAFFLTFIVFDQFVNRGAMFFEMMFKAVFWISFIVFAIYILLYFDLIPSIFTKREIPEYQSYRVAGPSLVLFLLLPIIYSMTHFHRKKYFKYILSSFVFGLISCGLSGSNRLLVLFVLFYTVALVDLSLKNIVLLLMMPIVAILVAANLSERHIEKAAQIVRPLEAGSVITRISDLKYAYNILEGKDNSIYYGEGFGVRTEVLRESLDGRKSKYREFFEIDNGFFYVLHRIGLIGLISYTFIFIYILFHYGSTKNRFMFGALFVITHALSIHYFTYILYALMTYIFVRDNRIIT